MHKLLAAIAALGVTFASAATDPAPETLLVKRGDIEVTTGDFLASIAKLPEDQRFSYRADVNRITTAVSGLYLARPRHKCARPRRRQGDARPPPRPRRRGAAPHPQL